MSRSRSPSITSLVLAAALSSAPGCGDDACGTGGAATGGLVAGNADVTLTYGELISSANNDCPDPAAPSGVISLTINATQSDGTGLLTFCVPRPDKLATGALGLGLSGSDFRIIDFSGSSGTCGFGIDALRPPSGTVGSKGLCNNGNDKAGYALVFDGGVSLLRTCGTTMDGQAVTLRGTIAVSVP